MIDVVKRITLYPTPRIALSVACSVRHVFTPSNTHHSLMCECQQGDKLGDRRGGQRGNCQGGRRGGQLYGRLGG